MSAIPNIPLLINGKKVQSAAKDWLDVLNPANQEVVARVPLAPVSEVDDAVASAKQAFQSWRNTSQGARAGSE